MNNFVSRGAYWITLRQSGRRFLRGRSNNHDRGRETAQGTRELHDVELMDWVIWLRGFTRDPVSVRVKNHSYMLLLIGPALPERMPLAKSQLYA